MKLIKQEFTVNYSFPVIFTRNVFDPTNPALLEVLQTSGEAPNRMLVVVDSSVLEATPRLPDLLERYASNHTPLMEFVAPPYLMRGERDLQAGTG